MTRLVLALVTTLAVAAPARTAAADPAPPDRRKIEDPRPWIIGFDLFSTGLVAGGSALLYAQRDCRSHGCGVGGAYMVLFGAMGYVAWPAAAYNDAGSRGRAVGSVALRITLPLAGIATAQALERDAGTTLAFAGAGMASAMLIDWLVLARDRPDRASPPVSLHAAPIDGGAIAGVSGAF